jgi:hypothetical protein
LLVMSTFFGVFPRFSMHKIMNNSVFHYVFHSLLKTCVENSVGCFFIKSAHIFVLLTKMIYFPKRG